jgi:hypothetical protein
MGSAKSALMDRNKVACFATPIISTYVCFVKEIFKWTTKETVYNIKTQAITTSNRVLKRLDFFWEPLFYYFFKYINNYILCV